MLNFLTGFGAVAALISAPVGMAFQAPAQEAPAAETVQPAALSPAQQSTLLKRASDALADVKTASGTFEQMAPDYTTSTGRFALSRPGKVRFDYDSPSPLLLVSDGATVALQDSELETTDRVPLGSTPLALLLDDDLDFESEADILDVTNTNNRVEITLRDKAGEMDGTLTLLMREADMSLTGWRTTDSGGNMTSVQLTDVTYDNRLNPRLFIVKDFDED